MTEYPTIHPKSRKEWRKWLEKNHAKEKTVGLLKYKKHTGKPTLTHQEAMDEAICFGWIDTTVKRVDDNIYMRRFSRRTKNSRWSKATQSYARRLIKEGRMAPAGLKAYQDGLQKPVIDHGLPKNPDTPKDLEAALKKNKKAHDFFKTLAPSYRRYMIYMVEKAKLPETRKKRIKDIVEKAAQHKKQ